MRHIYISEIANQSGETVRIYSVWFLKIPKNIDRMKSWCVKNFGEPRSPLNERIEIHNGWVWHWSESLQEFEFENTKELNLFLLSWNNPNEYDF
jgi:hypothetical protein